jgi:excisionase family DNA binding protein
MHQRESRLAVGMAEAALRLGLSARTIANLIKRKELPSRKVGRRRIIPVAALEAFVVRDQPTSDGADGAGFTESHSQRR